MHLKKAATGLEVFIAAGTAATAHLNLLT